MHILHLLLLLFNNQEVNKLMIMPLILITLVFDLRVKNVRRN